MARAALGATLAAPLLLAPGLRAETPAAAASGAAAGWLGSGIDLSVGGGLTETPRYFGARRKELSPAPYLSLGIGPDLQIDTTDGIRYTALRFGGISAGLAARYRPGRSSHDLPGRLRGLNGIKDAAEAGVFTSVESGPFSLDLLGTEDVASGHRAAGVEAHASVSVPIGDQALKQGVEAGPFVKAANRAYLQKMLGVSAQQAAATGLPVHSPGAGADVAGLEMNGSLALAPRWSLRGFASWGRLLGDAARSPVVKQGGSREQIASGLFLVFTP